jgi:two-component system chemotaxis response regulator CheY
MEKTVLIIDDGLFIRVYLRNIFEKLGYKEIYLAKDGIEGIELYKKNKPLITTLDINMPLMNGIATLKEIISFDKDAKVIMISSMDEKDLIQEAIQIGAKSFVIKSFDENTITSVLNDVLGDE